MPAGEVVTMHHALSGRTQRASRAAYDNVWAGEGWTIVSSEQWEPADAEKPIDKMKVDELKAHADKNGIDLGEATKKEDILAAIEVARLRAYAEEHGIELGDAAEKDDIVAAIELAEEGE